MQKEKIIEIVEIPPMDNSFMDDIMKGGVADSGIDSTGDVFF